MSLGPRCFRTSAAACSPSDKSSTAASRTLGWGAVSSVMIGHPRAQQHRGPCRVAARVAACLGYLGIEIRRCLGARDRILRGNAARRRRGPWLLGGEAGLTMIKGRAHGKHLQAEPVSDTRRGKGPGKVPAAGGWRRVRVRTLGTDPASTLLGGETCDQCNRIVNARCGFVCDMDMQIRPRFERWFKKSGTGLPERDANQSVLSL